MVTQPLSNRRTGSFPSGCLVAFFALFFLVGLVAFYFVLLRPAKQSLAARSWQALGPFTSPDGDYANVLSCCQPGPVVGQLEPGVLRQRLDQEMHTGHRPTRGTARGQPL